MKQPHKTTNLPASFTPKFWAEVDGRCYAVRQIRERIQELKQDTACDSMQRSLLCERAAFLSVRIESMEVAAVESGEFHAGTYANLSNSLLGILKALGLEKRAKSAIDLNTYLENTA